MIEVHNKMKFGIKVITFSVVAAVVPFVIIGFFPFIRRKVTYQFLICGLCINIVMIMFLKIISKRFDETKVQPLPSNDLLIQENYNSNLNSNINSNLNLNGSSIHVNNNSPAKYSSLRVSSTYRHGSPFASVKQKEKIEKYSIESLSNEKC